MSNPIEALEQAIERERAARRLSEQQLASCRRDMTRLADRQEQLLHERTRDIEQARDEALATTAVRGAFVANLSHEIRTPLTSIIGFAELLLDPGATVVDRHEAVSTIVRNGRHLLGLVNDVLDLSKIESGRIAAELVDVPLPVLLREITELVSCKVEERCLEFRVEPVLPLPAMVRTDPTRFKQILVNLVGNAVKFTRTGAVTLGLAWDATSRTLRFSVSDTGIGMSERQLEQIFQPFVQADLSTTRKYGGSGLGLYLSRQLAALIGGRITVHSRQGQGSAFHVDLAQPGSTVTDRLLTMEGDLIDFDRQAFMITQVSVPELRGRALVADDDADIRRLLKAYLDQAGIDTDIAIDGSEAIDKGVRGGFDLIVMDMQMPRIDGVEATRALRRAGVSTPIIALTASALSSDAQRFRDAGCEHVLAKPIDRVALYDALARLLVREPMAHRDDVADDLRATLDDLRREFLGTLPARLDRLARAFRERDWPVAQEVMHVLKGTAASFGCPDLTALAGAAELAIRMGEHGRAASLCAQVLVEGARVRAL